MSGLPSLPPASGGILITDEQAKAVGKLAEFGTTVVEETGQLARYVGKVLGTAPEDAVGIVLGDPLRFVRTAIAAKLDEWITRILRVERSRLSRLAPRLRFPCCGQLTMRAGPSCKSCGRTSLRRLWTPLGRAGFGARLLIRYSASTRSMPSCSKLAVIYRATRIRMPAIIWRHDFRFNSRK